MSVFKDEAKRNGMALGEYGEKILWEAVTEAIEDHRLAGHPICVYRDGKVVDIPPGRDKAAEAG